jgi:hypothetical protein
MVPQCQIKAFIFCSISILASMSISKWFIRLRHNGVS